MSWFKLFAAATALVTVSSAKELPWDEARSKEIYQNGLMMSQIKNQKEVGIDRIDLTRNNKLTQFRLCGRSRGQMA